MRKLKILSFLLAVLMLLPLLAACNGDKDTDEDDGPVVVTYYVTEGGAPVKVRVYDGEFHLAKTPTRFGYTFTGLYDSPSGGSLIVDENGDCLVSITHSVTLYAQWESKSYTVTLDPGEGKLPDGVGSTITVVYGGKLNILPVPERVGYTFLGWCLENGTRISNAGTVDGSYTTFNNDHYTFSDDETVKLVASYDTRMLSVTFDLNDGSYAKETKQIQFGKTLEEAGSLVPTGDTGRRRITGWSTYPTGTQPYTGVITEDMTLYAIWKEYRTVRLNAGAEGNGKEWTIYVYENEPFDLANYKGAALPGLDPDSWYTNSIYSGMPVTTLTYGTVGEVYYAKWKEATYTITFVSDVEDVQHMLPSERTYKYGESFTLPAMFVSGGNYNYTFYGWCKNPDCSDEPFQQITADMWGSYTLYAKIKPHTYMLWLDTQDGSSKTCVSVTFGETFTAPVPTREGHTFLGWYNAPREGYYNPTPITDAQGNGLKPYRFGDSITVYAWWEVAMYTVSYYEEAGATNPYKTETMAYGTHLKFPTPPSKSGKYFLGWSDGADAYTAFDTDVRVKENLKVYARWGSVDMSRAYASTTFKSILDGATEYEGNYYKLFKISVPWTTAKTLCEGLGGHLVTITSEGEQNFVYGIASAGEAYRCHLGATDSKVEGAWQWVTGETWDYQNFASGQPDLGTSENQLAFYETSRDGKWHDYQGDTFFICEWEKGEIDYVRHNVGTISSSNTLYDNAFYSAGHLYKVYSSSMSFSEARDYCKELGGHLASVGDVNENNALFYYTSQIVKTSDAAWGLSDTNREGTFTNATGEKVTYTNWNSGEPNNSGGGEDFVQFTTTGKWNDIGWKNCFICEWDYWQIGG